MATMEQCKNYLNSVEGEKYLSNLYGDSSSISTVQRRRYSDLLELFHSIFSENDHLSIISSPGRSEVGGNHTDHNGGRILAAAVDLDIVAIVARTDNDLIRVHSEGYPPSEVRISDLDVVKEERFTTSSLVRGIAARFRQLGLEIGGFDAAATSRVPKGSGLSSSAAYELLIATTLNDLYNQGQVDKVLLAKTGQYAENQYFGKPCGLMDQTTSAVGGFVTIDFKDFDYPVIRKVDFNFDRSGYSMVIVDTADDHADLSDEYQAIEKEMKSVAQVFGSRVLREISEEMVMENLSILRSKVSDRAVLRAIHFFQDDRRVVQQVEALESNDFARFLSLINKSGTSSWTLLQNCYSSKSIEHQGIPIALTASKALLKERGAWRVHGGGFAGTIQAFVPNEALPLYIDKIEQIFGQGSCHIVRVRPEGAVKVPC